MPYSSDTAAPAARKPVTLPSLREMHARGEPIAMLTCYDASFAALLDQCGVDVLLIGDSLGMVLQGASNTLEVTLEHVEYHTRCVARGNRTALIMADLPWATYQQSPQQAFASCARLVAAGASIIKVEGGAVFADTVRFLVDRGIPVCAHLGLTPQTTHVVGGYRVQGRDPRDAQRLLDDAAALVAAGASLVLVEMIPRELGRRLAGHVAVPTIGIGAGPDLGGQVLVLHDMLDVFPGRKARFVRNFMDGRASVADAIRAYVAAVKSREFPAAGHWFD